MFDVIAIVAAIVFIALVLQLRAMLALPFAEQTARLAPGDWARLLAADDVIATANPELAALGFEGPHWIAVSTQPAEAASVRAIACYRRAADGVLQFLLPLFLPETPNRCISYLVTRLADGRSIVSQPSDPFFQITAAPNEPAQLLAPAGYADLVKAHVSFVAQHGVAAADATSDAVIVDVAGRWVNARRERLIAGGQVELSQDGIARPKLGFAIRALRAFWSRPKWPANTTAIPPARLTLIAQNIARIRERAPTAAMQWLLFMASNVLFMLIGAVVFDLRFALILLVVIAIHEAGHYFAMRAFGYRNVQMLALPLVGGVTIGHERDPHATQRAWMSLMGPLPGIVIGWALLAMSWHGDVLASDWITQAAWIFLAVNYLNVVPILPLDGGHIVQAMLPARWYSLRIGFLVLACGVGALACFAFGLHVFAFFILLQLLQVPGLVQNRRVIKHLLAGGGMAHDALRARKLRLAFDALEKVVGPTAHASGRVAQAEDIVRSLEVVPMSWTSRLLTGGVYSALLVVPVLALVAGMAMFTGLGPFATEPTPRAATDDVTHAGRRDAAFAASATTDWPDLIAQFERPPWWSRLLFAVEDWPAPASESDLVDAERRAGSEMLPELREFYAIHDGFEALQLGAVADIVAVPAPGDTMHQDAVAMLETPFALVDLGGETGAQLRLGERELRACYSLAPKLDAAYAEYMAWPALLWCPELDSAGAAIVSVERNRAYRDFKVYVRECAAEQAASR